jgi:hypothetical protein
MYCNFESLRKGKCDFTQDVALRKGKFVDDHERRREGNGLETITIGKSEGFDSFNTLLEAQVLERRNRVKGAFPNLANSGRNSDSLRCSETTHKSVKMHEERIAR